MRLYCLSHWLMTICACFVLVNHSALSTSWRRVPLKSSLYPFCQFDEQNCSSRWFSSKIGKTIYEYDEFSDQDFELLIKKF